MHINCTKLDMLNNDILHIVVILVIVYTVNSVIVMVFATVFCVVFGRMACGHLGIATNQGQIKVFPWLGNF